MAQDRGLELLKARDSLAEPGSHPDVKRMSQSALRGQLAIRLKYRLRYDDSLDVVAIHGVGGVVGLAPTGSCVTTRPRAGPARLWSYTRRDQRER